MVEVIGYGEDALTYWALTKRIDFILHELGDGNSSKNSLLIYRPSFGRGRGANFGEFDAILATSKKIYLIESKWDRSKEIKNETVQLKPNQICRHTYFKWYFENWNKNNFQDWSSFVNRNEKEFQEKFKVKNIAKTNNDISKNIEFVINKLHEYSKNIEDVLDVLLFFEKKGSNVRLKIESGEIDFRLVKVEYDTISVGGYFKMNSISEEKR